MVTIDIEIYKSLHRYEIKFLPRVPVCIHDSIDIKPGWYTLPIYNGIIMWVDNAINHGTHRTLPDYYPPNDVHGQSMATKVSYVHNEWVGISKLDTTKLITIHNGFNSHTL